MDNIIVLRTIAGFLLANGITDESDLKSHVLAVYFAVDFAARAKRSGVRAPEVYGCLLEAVGMKSSAFTKLPTLDLSQYYETGYGAEYETLLAMEIRVIDADHFELNFGGGKRKSTGGFYTPENVVNYISSQALGPIAKNSSMRVLDPAMGSGFFLIGAARYLPTASTLSKEEIISNCLYGVDIDPLAVELGRLTLWLEMADENVPLSFLDDHLRCADSLLDFPQEILLDGFDAIIGNPPYLLGEAIPQAIRDAAKRFEYAKGQYDIYWLFYEAALKRWLKPHGTHGYIVPDPILARDETARIRKELTHNHRLISLAHAGGVFDDASVSGAVVVWQKDGNPSGQVSIDEISISGPRQKAIWEQAQFKSIPGCKWLIDCSSEDMAILGEIYARAQPLSDIASVSRGEELGKAQRLPIGSEDTIPILSGEDITCLRRPVPTMAIPCAKLKKKAANFASPKIVMVKTGGSIVASVDHQNLVTLQSVYNIHLKVDRYSEIALCAILCSRVLDFVAKRTFTNYKRIFPQFNQSTVLSLPICYSAEFQKDIESTAGKIIECADENERLELFDRLNAIIYSLYGLSNAQIEHIEATT